MLDTRGRIVAVMAAAALALSACGDDEPAASEGASETPSSDEPTTPAEETGPDNACPPDVAAAAPEGLDPESCWALPDAKNPVLVDGTLFALMSDPLDTEAPRHLVAVDPGTGEQLWMSEPISGAVSRIAAAEVDGSPGIGVVVTENDEGDALTESSEAWGYLAWPADSEADGDQPVEPVVHLSAPTSLTAPTGVYVTDQGVLAGDQFLAPGAGAFAQVNRAPEPMVVGDYDLDEYFAGVSGELLMSYVRGVAWTDDGGENGDTYLGWLARNADGTEAWNLVTATPNEQDVLFADGPNQLAMVIGGHLLTITPTDENYTAFELSWLDAATHEPATPTAADLAGARPISADSDVMAGDTGTMLSPGGRHLFASWSTLALIVDIEAGTVTRVPTDFEISGTTIDDTTVHGFTSHGTVTIDLATGEATAGAEGREGFAVVDEEFGAALVGAGIGETPYLVGGRRTYAG